MKKLSLLIIPIALVLVGVFVFTTGTKKTNAADGDRASYTLAPWTFWQTGVTTNDWNPWELSAYKSVYLPDDSDKYPDSVSVADGTTNFLRDYSQKRNFFIHSPIGTHAHDTPYELTAYGVTHGFIADVEKTGWSAEWGGESQTEEMTVPPMWTATAAPTTAAPETTTVDPSLPTEKPKPVDNNPYTLRAWTTVSNLKKNRAYTAVFDSYIDEGAYLSKLEGNQEVDEKYCKVVVKTLSGSTLYVRYLILNTQKQRFQLNFYMDGDNSAVKIELMYGAFLKYDGPIITHEEVNWVGVIHVEDLDVIQGNLNKPVETTTTRKKGGGGSWDDWDDEDEVKKPATVSGLKAKSKAKKSVTLSWKKAANATKYQVNYSLKSSFKSAKSKYTTGTSIKIKKLKRKKKYFFRVRGMNSTYTGAWSAKKKCKVK